MDRTRLLFARWTACWVFLFCAITPLVHAVDRPAGAPHAPQIEYRPSDPLNASAFDHFYNLDYDRSVQEFDQIMRRHPTDPFAINHMLTAVLMRELYRMGAMNSGEYANDSFVGEIHHPADPKVKDQINDLVQKAEGLEEDALNKNPNDVNALYARGVTRASFSIYVALVERAWISALRNAVSARRDHERVLELDPSYVDAKLVVGTHNYVTGSLPWAVKTAVSLVGLSGNKDKGFEYLYAGAKSNGENSIDAQVILCLFLRRERRYDEALGLMRGLIPLYPRNLLFALEEGNLLRNAGRNAEAAAVYRKIWQAGREGHYPYLHYEMAALSLGELLRSQKDFTGAAAAYEQVHEVSSLDPELAQRADLAAGEMYDLLQKRDLALKKYQAVVATDGSTPLAATARDRIKDPYRGS